MRLLMIAGLMVSILLLLAGCGGGGGSMSRRSFGALAFALTTPKTSYAIGETIPFRLTITNTGTQNVATYVYCGPAYDVYHESRILEGLPFCGIPEGFALTFAPGETRTYVRIPMNLNSESRFKMNTESR